MTAAPDIERREVHVRGIVQGVGFRPFVYSLARRYSLVGLVQNDALGVHVEVEGPPESVDLFVERIRAEAPPLAVVEGVSWQSRPVNGDTEFRIEESRPGTRRQALVSPDVATCPDCLRELFDPADRRYRYPFINCTNCGPRFTITRSVPYDRATTTMAGFAMCPACRSEYEDPVDRRFHAQPNACPACGPRVRLCDVDGKTIDRQGDDPIACAAALLLHGAILAVKGLGGYHLACNPFHTDAVEALRGRKVRQDKPFALMARDLEQIRAICRVHADEEALLAAPARPIVLLERRNGGTGPSIAEAVAPRQRTLGVMPAYTPLHHLLLHDAGIPLVMTSGNRSDEPIAYRDEEALDQLGGIADYFLVHDRPIHMRCDDSVVRVFRGADIQGRLYPVRRSRGYAPTPLAVPTTFDRHILACGAQLKNTFCLARDRYAFVSHHIGDLENFETLRSFTEGIEHYSRLFDVEPEVVACDLHPEYLSTKYARDLEEEGLPVVAVQHHHAHIAACLADNERPVTERVIGVAFDGTGYGTDGTIWGGEFFEGSIAEGFTRRAHLDLAPLPGGEAAIRQPWRAAIASLLRIYGEEATRELPLPLVREAEPRALRLIQQLVDAGTTGSWITPMTSSAGRLFDTVGALVGVPGSMRTTYEGQAAIELELAASGAADGAYPFHLRRDGDGWVVETREIITGVVDDVRAGRPAPRISSRFHRTMAEVVLRGCLCIGQENGVRAVALSGGTFQNMRLLRQAIDLLGDADFSVYAHRRVPANDGGISLGQAVLANGVFSGRI